MTMTQTRPPAAAPAHAASPTASQTQPTISQRDLRLHSREIMDAVEQGQTFTVTRNGREIGELKPMGHRRTLVPVAELFASAQGLPDIDEKKFYADIDAVINPYDDDPDPWNR
jgi:antitoxin (DNA-binding transcriptional repressor) of toxin-antitoxin stability system